jgi:hypothetical protein
MVFSAAKAAQIDKNGDKENQQIHSFDGLSRICHPRIRQRREGHKHKPQQREKQSVIGAFQVSREQEDQQQCNSREREKENQKETRHALNL